MDPNLKACVIKLPEENTGENFYCLAGEKSFLSRANRKEIMEKLAFIKIVFCTFTDTRNISKQVSKQRKKELTL